MKYVILAMVLGIGLFWSGVAFVSLRKPPLHANTLSQSDPYVQCAAIRQQVKKIDPDAEILEWYAMLSRGHQITLTFKVKANGREEDWTAFIGKFGTVEKVEQSTQLHL